MKRRVIYGAVAAALLFNLFIGGFVDWRKSLGYSGRPQWDPALYVYVVVAIVGMVLWSFVSPEKTVDGDQRKPLGRDAAGA